MQNPTPQATVNNHFHGAKISLGISLQKRKKKREKRKKEKKLEEFRPHFIYFFTILMDVSLIYATHTFYTLKRWKIIMFYFSFVLDDKRERE